MYFQLSSEILKITPFQLFRVGCWYGHRAHDGLVYGYFEIIRFKDLRCAIVTAPFGLLTVFGQMENESGLIMILPMLAGLPWVFLYFLFDIPGFTSPGLPGTTSSLSIFVLMLFMLPVYINVYFV